MSRKTSTSVQLEPDDESWAREVAQANHRSLSYVVRAALRALRTIMGEGKDLPPNGTPPRSDQGQ